MDNNPYQSPTGPSPRRAPAKPYRLTRAFVFGFASNLLANCAVILLSLVLLKGPTGTGLAILVNLLGMPVWILITLNCRVPAGMERYEDALSFSTLVFLNGMAWGWIAVAFAAARQSDREQ